MAPTESLANDVFADMGSRVSEVSAQTGTNSDEPKVVDEIESLCMNCHENGMTRLLLTKIPFFREVIIMSFHCPHCAFQNTEIQPAGEIQPKGAKYSLKLESLDDLNRQIVKSDTCIFRIEDLDLEIPPGRGQLSNVEGIVSMVASDLAEKQEERKQVQPELYDQISRIIDTLKKMATGSQLPFKISVDDPAGNSWIEPSQEVKAGKYSRHNYTRTPEQNSALGLAATSSENDSSDAPPTEIRPEYRASHMYPEMPDDASANNVDAEDEIVENQVYSFPASCPDCMKPCVTNMKMVNIPHFKQVVIMSTVCDQCGYRSNEVKTGGEVPEKGRRITVQIKNPEDLSRDILKSESCALYCPEVGLTVEPGSQGGRFTTIEGLLTQCRDDLRKAKFGDEDVQTAGDSIPQIEKQKWEKFFDDMEGAIGGRVQFTIVLEDPLAGSYVQSFADDGPDAQMKVEEYQRTDEEEEDLGLRDIKVEGYEGDPNLAAESGKEEAAT